MEAELSLEVELGDPSVLDVLDRTMEVLGVTQMEDIEEDMLHHTQLRAGENVFGYARRVGAFKTLAMEERSNEHWVAVFAS